MFEVVDAGRGLFIAELRPGGEAVVVERVEAAPADDVEISLYQAVPKGKHMDLVVEKATELGVAKVVPLATERGVVCLDGAGGKVERWRRLAEAAARQSLQLRVPEVAEPVAFCEAAFTVGGRGVLLHNAGGLRLLEEVLDGPAVDLFVGPEGGWSDGELRLAGEAGLRTAQLGPFRLRSETAGMVSVARARAVLEVVAERG